MATSPQKVVRGTSVLFQELFIEEDGTPLLPSDPSAYPSLSIMSPTEEAIQTGVATQVPASPGRWQFSWFVPADAELSTSDTPWQIEWVMLTNGGRQVTRSANFVICDNIEATPDERQYFNLTFCGQSERSLIKFKDRQDSVKVSLMCGSTVTDLSPTVQEVQQGQYYVYYVDTAPLTQTGSYMVVWNTRQTPLSPASTFIQQIRVPEMLFWQLQPDFRMLIDKLQKKIGHVQAYSDADLYGYLQRGVDIINQTNPITGWSLHSFPTQYGMTTFLIAAAAWWGLQAQYLSEGELSFSFSGQTVTLDVDRTGIYESAMSRLKDYLDSELEKTKRNALRRVSVGAIATRPYDFGLTSLVTRVQTVNGGNSQVLPLFSRLGLV
tara:strand:+ start:389 stop:1528 length:1140 start_codon:yes stop_codon:yes gene_type:complete